MTFGPVTPVDPTPLSWEDYQARTAGPIPEAEWTRWRAQAEDVVRQVTLGRYDTTTDEALLERLYAAVCVTADAAYAADGGVVSESLGGYSFTRQAVTRRDVDKVAMRSLAGTGLTYRGAYEDITTRAQLQTLDPYEGGAS